MLRARLDPIVEVILIQGDGEAPPMLLPNGEFADYGTWDESNLTGTDAKQPGMSATSTPATRRGPGSCSIGGSG